jgi:thioredoxin reductase (NADPH)
MHHELLQFQQQQPFSLNCIDIDENPELQRRYHDKVPVLAHGEYDISYYFLELPVLIEYLRSV